MGRRARNLTILLVLGAFMASAAYGLWWILGQAKRDIGAGDYQGLESMEEEAETVPEGGSRGLRRRGSEGSSEAPADLPGDDRP